MAKHPKQQPGADSLVEGLKLVKECPVCKAAYEPGMTTILEAYDEAELVHITCGSCTHAMIAIVAVSQFGMSTIGMMTDLTKTDAVRMRSRQAISGDDILNLHALLQKNTESAAHTFEHLIYRTTK